MQGIANWTYISWLPINTSLLEYGGPYCKKIIFVIMLLVLVWTLLPRVWRISCRSRQQEEIAKENQDTTHREVDPFPANQIASVNSVRVTPSARPHNWQNSGIRKRILCKNKNNTKTSRHFQADDAAGIPIGYYAVGEGNSPEHEIVRLYEEQ